MSAESDRGVGQAQAPAVRARAVTEALIGYALAGPGIVLLLLLFILPTLAVFVIAATDWQFGARAMSFVGLRNFVALAGDRTFRAAIANTALYVVTVVPVTVALGLLVALLIESGKTLRAFYRAIHFLPYMATMAAMAIAWEALLHPTVGWLTQFVQLLGFPAVNWLRNERTALWVLVAIGVWQNLGFAMVLFLSGLKSIPQDLYDAADVDGADATLDRLRTVTLPLLGPVTMFVVIIVAIKALCVFDTVQILTQGGPGQSTETLLHALYAESFVYLRTGYGAALTVAFLAIVVALTLLQARFFDKRVHYT